VSFDRVPASEILLLFTLLILHFWAEDRHGTAFACVRVFASGGAPQRRGRVGGGGFVVVA
jgi:hypothetical protein